MCGYALVIQPWESGIVHHCIDFWQHGIHSADTDFAFDFITSEEHLISYFVTSGTVSLLFHDSAENLPGFVADAFVICHIIE